METLYLGIDIGGTKCVILVGDRNVNVLETVRFLTPKDKAPEKIVEEMIGICKELMEKYKDWGAFRTVGISCGGPLDDKKGVILSPPNLPDWDAVPITDMIEKELHIPAFIQNDANACAMAEWKFGAGKGCDNMVFMTFGTGLGAGIILDGRLYSGTNGMAGESGHIRLTETGPIGYGKEGSFEGYCSGGGIKDLCRVLTKQEKGEQAETITFGETTYSLEKVTAQNVFEHAAAGDPLALRIVDICAFQLGRGLSIIIDLLNPQKIVLGSIFVRGEHLLREKMQQVIDRETLSFSRSVCQVVPAALGESIGNIAALTVAIYND